MRPLVLNLVLAVTACGGQVETSSSVGGGQAGAGVRSSSSGGASAIPFGTGGAETCPLEQLALAVCGRACCPVIGCGSNLFNAKDLRNCRLQLNVSPSDGENTAVIVNCAPFSHFGGWVQDAGTLDGWTYDYSTEPATLVFGAAACDHSNEWAQSMLRLRSGATTSASGGFCWLPAASASAGIGQHIADSACDHTTAW